MSGDSISPPEMIRSPNDTEFIDSRVASQKMNEYGRHANSVNSEFNERWDGQVLHEFDVTKSKCLQIGRTDSLDHERKELWGK